MTTREAISNALWETGGYIYDPNSRNPVEKVILRTWRSLEDNGLIEEPDAHNGRNGFRILSEKGRAALTTFDFEATRSRSRFTRDMFHPALPDAAWDAFRAENYDAAVFEAFKAVEIAVRNKGLGKNRITQDDHGVLLMKKAFESNHGPLTDMKAKPGRRERRCELFTGALGELRNPKAHQDPTITDPLVAVEEIMTAGALLRIVDRA